MKTFSLMSIPDLILTKAAYLRLIIKTKADIELIHSAVKSDEDLVNIQNNLARLIELHEAVCVEFPEVAENEYNKLSRDK